MTNKEFSWMNEELIKFRDSINRFFNAEFVPNIERWEKQGMLDKSETSWWLRLYERISYCPDVCGFSC